MAAGDDSGDFSAFVLGTNTVPENSADMNVDLAGTLLGSDTNSKVDVGYDDVSVTLTGCLDNFAKISGKVTGTGGKRGQFSFEGTVGLDHDLATFSGSISINYKANDFSCVFTPSAITFTGFTALVDASYVCDGTGPTQTSLTAAQIRLVPGTGGPEGRGKNKDRGKVCVEALDDALDIGSSLPDPDCVTDDSDTVALKSGNINTDNNTGNGPLI